VEKLGDRTALAALLGAGGVLAATGDPARAAELMAATMPRAARQGREAFAAVLGRELARRDVVTMDAGALRRLDRVSVVVVDSSALGTGEPRILDAAALVPGVTDAEMWRIAQKALAEPSPPDGPRSSTGSAAPTGSAPNRPDLTTDAPWQAGPWRFDHAPDAPRGRLGGPVALTLDVRHSYDTRGGRHGRVRVGVDVDPLAEAVLAAARGSGVRLAMTSHDSVGDLAAWADDVIAGHEVLAEYVRSLQADGHGVLVVSATDDEALAAADVGVAVTRPGGPVCWSADLLCGPDLGEVWRVLRSVATAHAVSQQAARLAVGGSALGALLTMTGRRRPRLSPQNVPPIHGAALLAVFDGAFSAFRLGYLTPPPPAVRANWHDLTPEEAFQRLERGLGSPPPAEPPRGRLVTAVRSARSRAEALVRASALSGVVTPPLRNSAALSQAVARELRDPLTPVLVFGAAASAVVGSGVDAVLVGGVVAGNALVGGAQRLRAERALRRLLLGEKVQAQRVSRRPEDGAAPRRWEDVASAKPTAADPEPIPADELRPGDVVRVEVGDVVPADLRLLDSDGLEADESSLTGESLPVDKSAVATPGAELDERSCMLYEGCTVLTGTGLGLVVAVGRDTEAGRAAAVAGTAAPSAGLQARLAGLTRAALPAAGVGGLAVAVVSALRGVPFRQAVASGVAVGVAAVPEGLPLVATVAQLAAARRLAPRGILVRSSRTLEALGRVDTVCFDKTGTLTRGRLSVTAVADVEGGVAPGGAVGRRVLKTAARACPDPGDEGAASALHATDRAVLDAAHERLGHDVDWTLRADLPFETNRGYSASLGSNSPKVVLAVKGAPEVVLALCSKVRDRHGKRRKLSGQQRRAAEDAVTRMAGDGLRVLAVAEKRPQTTPEPDPDLEAMAEDLTLLGFVGIADTPRADAGEAVRRLAEAGVRVTMITGDHPETATAIARDLGIPDPHLVMTGAEFDRLPERPRIEQVAATTVFARVSPQQKVKIVRALQKAGRVVAMTGDGSNDAAAIRAADVGIALAGHGSAAARSAADLVLAEPDPVRIADALAEGRALWDRVQDAASILVGGNAGEVAFTVLGTAVGGRNPLNTRQLLLVNMLTDMMPALAVALAPAKAATAGGVAGHGVATSGDHATGQGDDTATYTAPRPTDGTWDPALVRGLAIRGTATAAGAMLAWIFGRVTGRRSRAGTMALAALVGTQLGQTLATGRHSALVGATTAVSALALFAVIQTPGVSHFFGCTPLGPVAWAAVAASSVAATLGAVAAPTVLDRFGIGVPVAANGAAAHP
jgi:cation-transporting ATPase I